MPHVWDQLDPQQQQGMRWLVQRINMHKMRHDVASLQSTRQTADTPHTQAERRTALLGRAETTSASVRPVRPTPASPMLLMEGIEDVPSTGRRLINVYNKIRDDEAFKHLRAESAFVPGEGPWPNPKAMVIGEAPGENEERLQRPFVGKAGNFLDTCFYEAGLKRQDVFITNVVKYRPPSNRTPTQEEIELSIPHLRRELQVVMPNGGMVILLGSVPLNVVDPSLRVGKCHGDSFTVTNWTFVPMYHPAFILRGQSRREMYKKDWQKIKELLAA